MEEREKGGREWSGGEGKEEGEGRKRKMRGGGSRVEEKERRRREMTGGGRRAEEGKGWRMVVADMVRTVRHLIEPSKKPSSLSETGSSVSTSCIFEHR